MRNCRSYPFYLLCVGATLASPTIRAAHPMLLESTESAAHLLELFSSEGCSSCPPADLWLASLRSDPQLWKTVVPIELHVDYWNRLGWRDRYSRAEFSARQSDYARAWGNDHVYTPGFVLDGSEWREKHVPAALGARVGVLRAQALGANRYSVSFAPTGGGNDWVVRGALLGNGIASEVTSGENQGTTLRHEFVVLALETREMKKQDHAWTANLELTAPADLKARSHSVVFWIEKRGEPRPVQAVGGDID